MIDLVVPRALPRLQENKPQSMDVPVDFSIWLSRNDVFAKSHYCSRWQGSAAVAVLGAEVLYLGRGLFD
jgi:hypothetical protein